MLTKIKGIYYDTHYFVIKNIGAIFFISIVTTLISGMIGVIIKPNMYIISLIEKNKFSDIDSVMSIINSMNHYEKREILKYSIFKIIESLISKTFLLTNIIALISIVSNKKKSIMLYTQMIYQLFPSIFLIHFISMLIVHTSSIFFILPGIMLSCLLLLSPIIFSFNKNKLFDTIYFSIHTSWKNIKIIGPAIILWILSKFFLITILSHIIFNQTLYFFILNTSINILYAILNIYLFRFYMIFMQSRHA
ncbi:YciC family protein [Buchnera aphidicola]|uniref:YciC family protein n=1 Tax=Buchnera aphidicola TaxID=9 RepID=UPI0034639F95